MKISNCVGCSLPALSLRGPFVLLDSFYLAECGPPPDSAGKWHWSCLANTDLGPAWRKAFKTNFVRVRHYDEVAESDDWCVVRHPRTKETVAISREGGLLSLGFAAGKVRNSAGGKIYKVEEGERHIELDDQAIVKTVQESLSSTKRFPIMELLELMGTADRVVHPEALEDSALLLDARLQRSWTRASVSVRWEHGVFVPDELLKYVLTTK
jgi:hypothetical protein